MPKSDRSDLCVKQECDVCPEIIVRKEFRGVGEGMESVSSVPGAVELFLRAMWIVYKTCSLSFFHSIW